MSVGRYGAAAMTEVGDTAAFLLAHSGASGGAITSNSVAGRHGDRGYRAVRLRSDLSGGPTTWLPTASRYSQGVSGAHSDWCRGPPTACCKPPARSAAGVRPDVSGDRRTHRCGSPGWSALSSLVVIAGSSPLLGRRVFAGRAGYRSHCSASGWLGLPTRPPCWA